MLNFIQTIYNDYLSVLMMVCLILVGVFMTVRSKALQIRRFGYAMKNTVGSLFNKNIHAREKGSVSPFQAVTTALAGTIGTGSIAGLGSAPIAHSASSTKGPVKQGLWGMFEVFVTTIIICTMTALVILSSDTYLSAYNQGVKPVVDGAALSSYAFNDAIPYFGKIVITVATVFFSLSTILGWAYYGEVSVGYIFSKHRNLSIMIYRTL